MLSIRDFCVSLKEYMLSYNKQMFSCFFFKLSFIAHFPRYFPTCILSTYYLKSIIFVSVPCCSGAYTVRVVNTSPLLYIYAHWTVYVQYIQDCTLKNNEVALWYSKHSRKYLLHKDCSMYPLFIDSSMFYP